MTELDLFTYDGSDFRAVTIDGASHFIAADALRALDLGRSSLALLEDEDKGVHSVDTPGGSQQMATVTEAGLYSLILRSRKTEAKAFKRWITHEVIPQIRRTGSFNPTPEFSIDLANRDHIHLIIQAANAQMIRADEAEAKVAELEPVAGRFLNADGDYSVADAAKALTRAGVKVGPNRLFTVLENNGWIYRAKGDGRWRVMQSAIELGVMSVIPQSHYHPKTGVLVLDPPQPRVTPKGVQKVLLAHGGSELAVR